MRSRSILGVLAATTLTACVARAPATLIPAPSQPTAPPIATGAPPTSAPASPSIPPASATPQPPVAAGMTRFDVPNLGLTIDLPESWVDVFDLSLRELTTLEERDPLLTSHATSWVSVPVRFAEGGDTGLIAVDRMTGSVLRTLYAAPANVGADVREVADAVISVDGYEPEHIASTMETVVLGSPGVRYDLRIPQNEQHRLLVEVFRAPNEDWARVDLAAPLAITDADTFFASTVSTMHSTGVAPNGAFHAVRPDQTLQDILPAELGGQRLAVLTGPKIDLEYAGLFDDWLRAFGSDWETLPGFEGRVDEARMGVAYASTDGARVEIFAFRIPGFATEDWRPLTDPLTDQGWKPLDPERITFESGDGTNIGGPRGDTVFNIAGTPALRDAAVKLLLPAP